MTSRRWTPSGAPFFILGPEGFTLGFILDDACGPLHTGEIERAKEWGAQVVRTSVANPEGWAIWDRLNVGNE